ncbi:ABC transporter substrate-binding protein [Flexivirga sp. B27]
MNTTARRRTMLLAALLTVPLTLTACGSGSTATSAAPASGSAPGGGADSAFPRTVQATHGKVTIKSAPQRVVVLGGQPAEAVLALGVTPVAIDTYGAPYTPWLKGKTRGAKHQTLSDSKSVKIEAVAANRPDLIIVSNWLMRLPGVANKLQNLAPTVDVAGSAVNPDWDKVITSTADALGKPKQGSKLIAGLKKQMSAVSKDVPKGSTYNWVRYDANGWGFGNGSLLDSFGLQPAKGQDNTNRKVLSTERTRELIGDSVFVWAYGKSAADVQQAPGVRQLPASKNGTLQVVDQDFATALNSPGVYSIPWLIDEITPTLDKLSKSAGK